MLSKTDLKEIKNLLGSTLNPVKKDLKEIKQTTTANTASLMNLEKEIGIYNDGLDIERKRINRHEERLSQLEKF